MDTTLSRGSTRKMRDVKMHAITAIVYKSTGNASKQLMKAEMRSCICGKRLTSLRSLITGTKTRRMSLQSRSEKSPKCPTEIESSKGSAESASMMLLTFARKALELGQKTKRT